LLNAQVKAPEMIVPLLLIFLYILCIGAFGYFVNDVFDKKADVKSGKPIKSVKLSRVASIAIPLILLSVATIPFVFIFSAPQHYLLLVGIHVLLLFTYSVPYIKIKASILGLFWDALYSYVMPALITVAIVRQCCIIPDITPFRTALPIIWLSLLGLRSILNHQIADYEYDVKSGIHTFVVSVGRRLAVKVSVIITVAELVFFVFMLVFAFDFLWKIVLLSLFLFVITEVILSNKNFLKMYNKGGVWAVINQFYDYYLFMGVMLWMAWQMHPACLLIPAVFVIYRLHLHKWFYYHVVLWIYFKVKGGKRKIMGK
jgi:4-hydroxybenzoate polyprenyltransferase